MADELGSETADANSKSNVGQRLTRRGLRTLLEAARTWAWANPFVPVSLVAIAITARVLHRRRRQTRLGDALDATLVTARPLLEPQPGGLVPSPMAGARRKVLDWITQGAEARQSA